MLAIGAAALPCEKGRRLRDPAASSTVSSTLCVPQCIHIIEASTKLIGDSLSHGLSHGVNLGDVIAEGGTGVGVSCL
jgi:hypothetical protein